MLIVLYQGKLPACCQPKSPLMSWQSWHAIWSTQYNPVQESQASGSLPCPSSTTGGGLAQSMPTSRQFERGTKYGEQSRKQRRNKARTTYKQGHANRNDPADFHFFFCCQVSVVTTLPRFRVQSLLCVYLALAIQLVFAWRRDCLDDFTLVEMWFFPVPIC